MILYAKVTKPITFNQVNKVYNNTQITGSFERLKRHDTYYVAQAIL